MHSQYIETALWSSTDYEGERSLDSGDFVLSDKAREFLESRAEEFRKANPISCTVWNNLFGEGQWEHDLWLTQNGHGTGFWDRTVPKEPVYKRLQDSLNAKAKAIGELDLYIADDGVTVECLQNI